MNQASSARRRPNPLFTVFFVAGAAAMGMLTIVPFINGHLASGAACAAAFFVLFTVAERRLRKTLQGE